jgi:hypothetical protein
MRGSSFDLDVDIIAVVNPGCYRQLQQAAP